MAFHMLFPIFMKVCGKVIAFITGITFIVISCSMYCKVCFSHKPPATPFRNALVCFDGRMHYLMLVQLTLKIKSLATFVVVNGCPSFPRQVAQQQLSSTYGLGYWCCAPPSFAYTIKLQPPRPPLAFHLAMGGWCLCGHCACIPHLNFL